MKIMLNKIVVDNVDLFELSNDDIKTIFTQKTENNITFFDDKNNNALFILQQKFNEDTPLERKRSLTLNINNTYNDNSVNTLSVSNNIRSSSVNVIKCDNMINLSIKDKLELLKDKINFYTEDISNLEYFIKENKFILLLDTDIIFEYQLPETSAQKHNWFVRFLIAIIHILQVFVDLLTGKGKKKA